MHRYINKNFFTDIINETEKVNKLIVLDKRINVDGMYGLNYFINKTIGVHGVLYDIHEIKSSDYYCAFSVYMFNKIIGKLNYNDRNRNYYKYEIDNTKYSDLTKKFICTDIDCKDPDKINKDTYKQEVIKQYEEIIETKTSLINKVFMDNQKYTPPAPAF